MVVVFLGFVNETLLFWEVSWVFWLLDLLNFGFSILLHIFSIFFFYFIRLLSPFFIPWSFSNRRNHTRILISKNIIIFWCLVIMVTRFLGRTFIWLLIVILPEAKLNIMCPIFLFMTKAARTSIRKLVFVFLSRKIIHLNWLFLLFFVRSVLESSGVLQFTKVIFGMFGFLDILFV